jgi:hypothetical protein
VCYLNPGDTNEAEWLDNGVVFCCIHDPDVRSSKGGIVLRKILPIALLCFLPGCDSSFFRDDIFDFDFLQFEEIEHSSRGDTTEVPIVNVPMDLRQRNWTVGSRSNGSCVWASTITLLRWQGMYSKAAWIKKNYGGGEFPWTTASKLDDAGIYYAYTTEGDESFLEWAISTGRGCNIDVKGGRHMVTLVHLTKEWAGILDNNNVRRIRWIPRGRLLAEWRAGKGWGLTTVYPPAAPMPRT